MVEILNGARMIPPIRKVGVSNQVDDGIFAHLNAAGWESEVIEAPSKTDDLINLIRSKGFQALIGRTDIKLLDERVLRECPDLSLFLAACRDPRLNIQALRENGVWALRANSNTQNVAECVVHLIEGLGLGTISAVRATDIDYFDKIAIGADTFKLRGKRLGIAGLGEIGGRLAALALSKGMNVDFCNDGSGQRNYDRKVLDPRVEDLKILAEKNGATFRRVPSLPELAGAADILSLHLNGESAQGGKNAGIITDEILDALNHEGGLRILINFARRPLLPQTDHELLKRIEGNKLGYFLTDVYDPELEKNGVFKHPAGPDSGFAPEVARRFIGTSHIGGSGPEVGSDTADYIGERLIPQWTEGSIGMGDSTLYLRHSLERDNRMPGDVVFTLSRSTQRGIVRQLGDVIDGLGFSLISSGQSIADFQADTNIDHLWVPSTFVLKANGHNGAYADSVRALANGITSLNTGAGGKTIVNMRFVPTSPEQKDVLSDPNFRYAHNLGEI